MKNRLTLQEWWKKFIGYKYLVNHKSREIHDLSRHHVNCHTSIISNKEFVHKRKMDFLIIEGYDGCRWCMPEKDNG